MQPSKATVTSLFSTPSSVSDPDFSKGLCLDAGEAGRPLVD